MQKQCRFLIFILLGVKLSFAATFLYAAENKCKTRGAIPGFYVTSDFVNNWTAWNKEIGLIRFDPTRLTMIGAIITNMSVDITSPDYLYIATSIRVECEGTYVQLRRIKHKAGRYSSQPAAPDCIELFKDYQPHIHQTVIDSKLNPSIGAINVGVCDGKKERHEVTWVNETTELEFLNYLDRSQSPRMDSLIATDVAHRLKRAKLAIEVYENSSADDYK